MKNLYNELINEERVILMQQIKSLESKIFALESRIESEVRWSNMTHELCNKYQQENDELKREIERMIKENK